MNWNEIAWKLLEAILPITTVFLTALIGLGIAYIRKRLVAIEDERIKELIDRALSEAEKVAEDAILATNQVFVDSIKKAREDGKLTREEARQAIELAKSYFYSHITSSSLNILSQLFSDINGWLEQYLEAKLGLIKKIS